MTDAYNIYASKPHDKNEYLQTQMPSMVTGLALLKIQHKYLK